jgi:hypothetical protein
MSTDVVCVLNASLAQVFEKARPMKASVKRDSKPMEHPLETGATVTDHRIVLPTEIELSLILAGEDDYRTTYRQIADLFLKGELLTVQTRVDTFTNVVIQTMPHDEDPEHFDAVLLALRLREVQYVDARFTTVKVKHKKDSRTVKRGEQQPQDASSRQSSVLSRLFK